MRFIGLVYANLLHHRLRSLLTITGMAISVVAVVVLSSVARGYVGASRDYYESRGVDIVAVRAGVAERLTSRLSTRIAERLVTCKGVAVAEGSLTEMVSLGDGDFVGVPLHGYPLGGIMLTQLDVIEGRMLAGSGEVLLGSQLALAVRKQVGERLDIEGQSFLVAGIFQSDNAIELNTAVVILSDLQALVDQADRVSEIQIQVADGVVGEAALDEVCQAIESLVAADGQSLGLNATPTRAFVESSSESKLMSAMASGTSAMALGLAWLGIVNTFWTSVLARRHELGILRALGWSRRRVFRMIVWEAILLSLVGLACGLLIAKVLLVLIASQTAVRVFVVPQLDPLASLLGTVSLITVSVLGAMIPAWRATVVPALEAIRDE